MKNGLSRFEYYLKQLEVLLQKAAKQKNPALYLYQNNGRTTLFMLEGLCKLYAGLHNKKKFTKLKEHCKMLEDGLGAIDFYDVFAIQFAANKKIPATVTAYCKAQALKKEQELNHVLTEKKWLQATDGRIAKFREKLKEANWLEDEKEVAAIAAFYGEAILDIIEFVHDTKYHFDDVEHDVHELRRKLRWLSIYPQALQGCVQLVKTAAKPIKQQAKYCTKAIIQSPFNKLPDAGSNRHFLLLQKNSFYALSWMIAALGNLKDNGLAVIAIKEALLQNGGIADKTATTKAMALMGKKQTPIPQLLKKAEGICKFFFAEHHLEYLVQGTATVK
jgi:hypothetical protein